MEDLIQSEGAPSTCANEESGTDNVVSSSCTPSATSPSNHDAASETKEGGDGETPQFKMHEKVYARDEDGLLYKGVIQRSLYGRSGIRQCKLGYISFQESEHLCSLDLDDEPSWQYFIHFDGWSAKWDRWVLEDSLFRLDNPVVQKYAQRLSKEHRSLMMSLKKGGKKKITSSADSAGFLQAWRKVVDKVDFQMKMPNPQLDILRGISRKVPTSLDEIDIEKNCDSQVETTTSTTTCQPERKRKRRRETGVALEHEKSLRTRSLTKRDHNFALSQQTIVLPQPLRKVLVDQWEIICQCNMLSSIPAPITVRHALNEYIRSKGVSTDNNPLEKLPASSNERQQAPSNHVDPLSKKFPQDDSITDRQGELKPNAVSLSSEEAKPIPNIQKPPSSTPFVEAGLDCSSSQGIINTESGTPPVSETDDKTNKNTPGDLCPSQEKDQSTACANNDGVKPTSTSAELPMSTDITIDCESRAPIDTLEKVDPGTTLSKIEVSIGTKSEKTKRQKGLLAKSKHEAIRSETPQLDSDSCTGQLSSRSSQTASETTASIPLSLSGAEGIPANNEDNRTNEDAERQRQQLQEWRDMADGIALFFDEGLENLLYRQEYGQLREIKTNPEFEGKSYAEIYGTEYLLRLFVRLPQIMSESNLPPNEVKLILAKINDFIRFLTKNQSTLFSQKHERP